MPPSLVGALDQGTTSTRFVLYRIENRARAKLTPVASHQMEHRQIFPQPGWCEHDPEEIVANSLECMSHALAKVPGGAAKEDVACVGITNQRETTVAWDSVTGKPLHNALVWLDTRTQRVCDDLVTALGSADALRAQNGLPISTYFSGTKMRWLVEHVDAVRAAAGNGTLRVGTMETWLVWSLTRENNFVTDVTNASRTMLMDLRTLSWDTNLCAKVFGVNANATKLPESALPKIVSNCEFEKFGIIQRGALAGVKITATIGDQHAATLGQRCTPGEAKNTYGTGCFALLNTGYGEPVFSQKGLCTTIAWRLGDDQAVAFALEGSIAIAGAGVAWLRDNLGIIKDAAEVEAKASAVPDSGGVTFVPAFSGLFAPRWRPDARGVIVGLTQHSNANHICRALLDAICFQTKDVLDAMNFDMNFSAATAAEADSTNGGNQTQSRSIKCLRVDGGASANGLLMQTQADVLGVNVARPGNVETTALGAALAAGVGARLWSSSDIFAKELGEEGDDEETVFACTTDAETRQEKYEKWADAVERSLGLA
jgi:glycerol kinase|tara:strand:- start:1894 stop:3519 length:1626 start_codon:yes stop_codon:yes gene_type:complete|mmetsp:Transcript_6839/g.23089  ORF Transcript_6839/g.23089 Transcript_6839/m.23089 type:complete len:542 (+) Transcript_6839:89-1714(+)